MWQDWIVLCPHLEPIIAYSVASSYPLPLLVSVPSSTALPGLHARLDRLVYHRGGSSLPPDKPHAFVYFITIENLSGKTVQLLGRKWVVEQDDGQRQVIEAEKIVGETPRLNRGESFSYNSFHVTGANSRVVGSFHGTDDSGALIHVILPPFEMIIPEAEPE